MGAAVMFQAEGSAGSGVIVKFDSVRRRVIVAPRGHWTILTAKPAIEAFKQTVAKGVTEFVGDCRAMDGYDTDVRVAWQSAFMASRRQLRTVVFLGVRSSIIRMGVTTMAMILRMDMKIVDTLEGLDE